MKFAPSLWHFYSSHPAALSSKYLTGSNPVMLKGKVAIPSKTPELPDNSSGIWLFDSV